MTRKGLIFSAKAENGDVVYQAAPFVIGIYEFQVNRLTDGFLKDLGEYWGTARALALAVRTPTPGPTALISPDSITMPARNHS